jgi:hypothetical protein
MRHLLITLVAIFAFAGAQAAEPRANKGKVNKIIKAIKALDSKQIKVNEYDGDSIAEDIKKQLYEQFDEKKVDKVWKANKITLNTSILAESQSEEGYNNMRAFVAKLNIENSENLAGVPMTMNNKSDSVAIILFSDKNNMFIFSDSLLSKKYRIIYTDDDITTKSQNMLTQLVNDKFEQITSGGLISKFKGSKEKTIAFEAADEKGKRKKSPQVSKASANISTNWAMKCTTMYGGPMNRQYIAHLHSGTAYPLFATSSKNRNTPTRMSARRYTTTKAPPRRDILNWHTTLGSPCFQEKNKEKKPTSATSIWSAYGQQTHWECACANIRVGKM